MAEKERRGALAGARVLVTGGCGFIGSNVAHALVAQGAIVTVLDSMAPGCGGNRANLGGIVDRIRVVVGDIRDEARVDAEVRAHDAVVNCAALTSHTRSFDAPHEVLGVNCGGVLTLLESIRRAGRPVRFVQIGTSTQLGRMLQEPATETHPEFPSDVYSATKTAAEKLTLAYGRAQGLPVVVLRLANVYGPRAKITDPGLGFMSYFVGLALQGSDLTVFGDGRQRRTVTFVDDVVDAILRSLVSDACLGDVLFATSEERPSVREIADAIARVVGGRVRSVDWPAARAAMESGDAVVSSARIATVLGWRARTSLEDGLALTRDYYRPRLPAYVS